MKKEINYYQSELSKIDTKSEYAPQIVISDAEGNKTKSLNLNKESKDELIKWLNENF